ncbi:phosphatidate cytidylyltransferase [Heyndrickxia acidicola]|uniref:Phosphatidate cytidylyltransferase n=1 Tax=Heyndrickxia acidicola TaxID=209389 RepID=A0ABU6MCB0_9BACI|nr:phosphatidate cytidylyltransferase [Heyndrickxia acidicola]MED1202042.1 phosphatidate cytidylyltransferase [Heyndrickxia acidicola]
MKQRIITAVIAAALFIPIVFWGKSPFILLVYVMGTIALYELCKMKKISFWSLPGIISLLILWVFLAPDQYNILFRSIGYNREQVILIGILLLLMLTVVSKNRYTFDDISFVVFSALYVGIGFHYFLLTREASKGLLYIFYALLLIWATDSGAYFIGKAMGKHKLWPDISPNKTIEGSIGGIICALVVAVCFNLFTSIDIPMARMLADTALLSILGQLGDLVESAFKRHYHVKDSGNILPGHGGILDRFDSLLFVFPFIHFLHLIH